MNTLYHLKHERPRLSRARVRKPDPKTGRACRETGQTGPWPVSRPAASASSPKNSDSVLCRARERLESVAPTGRYFSESLSSRTPSAGGRGGRRRAGLARVSAPFV